VASPLDRVRKYEESRAARNHDEAQYFANVENIDAAVGRLLAALDKLKLGDNTLVIFTSDNGPETLNRYRGSQRSYGRPGPLRGMKLHVHEAGYRVAGIMRWPQRITGGQVSDEPVCSLDFLPTFCKVAGVDVTEDLVLDGANFLPALEGRDIPRQRPLFWFYYNALNEAKVAMIDSDWKILAQLEDPENPRQALPQLSHINAANEARVRGAGLMEFELYDLSADTSEANNLADTNPDQLARLRRKLEARYRDVLNTQHIWPVVNTP
jgi:arylsulfatase A